MVQGGNDTLVDVNVARDFVEKFRRVALSPIYYVELPFTQHAFDVTASPRTSATTRAAVVFAESVVRDVDRRSRPNCSRVYQVPPTELRVELSSSRRVEATEAARELGPYWVVTADNPFSQRLERRTERTAPGRTRRGALVARADATARRVAHDPSGRWPDEEGFAVFGTSEAFVRTLARSLRPVRVLLRRRRRSARRAL